MLEEFFQLHDFREKIKMLNFSFRKDFFLISPSLVMGWISEWSKKKYYETLYEEMKVDRKIEERKKGSVSCGSN